MSPRVQSLETGQKGAKKIVLYDEVFLLYQYNFFLSCVFLINNLLNPSNLNEKKYFSMTLEAYNVYLVCTSFYYNTCFNYSINQDSANKPTQGLNYTTGKKKLKTLQEEFKPGAM